MAITVKDLAIELRLSVDGDDLDAAQTAVLTRLKAVGESLVDAYADGAPDSVRDEAVIRVCAFLYDVAPAMATTPTNPLMLSGAQSLLSLWRPQRAHVLGGDDPEDLT